MEECSLIAEDRDSYIIPYDLLKLESSIISLLNSNNKIVRQRFARGCRSDSLFDIVKESSSTIN